MKRQLHMTTTKKGPETHLFGERLRTLTRKSPIILVVLLIEILLFAVLSKSFLTVGNLISVTRQASVTAIISFGMTLVIITGGIDLSVGSIVAVSGVLTAFEMKMGMPVALAVVFGLAIGFVAGGINGVVIGMTNIPAFAVTLGMMTAMRGVAGLISRGSPISVSDQVEFLKIGGGYVEMVPIPVIIALVVFFVLHLFLSHTKFGVNVYAVGGNESAANLCGINVKKVKTLVYIINGVLSAISGIVLTSRLYSGDPSVGSGFELDAIAATILGGTSLNGGTGNLVGTLLGSLTIAVLLNGLTLLNVPYYNQLVIRGLVVMFALILMPKTD